MRLTYESKHDLCYTSVSLNFKNTTIIQKANHVQGLFIYAFHLYSGSGATLTLSPSHPTL